jgi:hypothetical protein
MTPTDRDIFDGYQKRNRQEYWRRAKEIAKDILAAVALVVFAILFWIIVAVLQYQPHP